MTGNEVWSLISRFLPIADEKYIEAYVTVYKALKEFDERRSKTK